MDRSYSTDEADITLETLSYSTRLLVSELDEERFIQLALETLTDFGKGKRAILYQFDERNRSILKVVGDLNEGVFQQHYTALPIQGTAFDLILSSREIKKRALEEHDKLLLPVTESAATPDQCLTLPLYNRRNEIFGIVVLQLLENQSPSDFEMKVLHVLIALISVSLENAHLFQLATVDGLTKLYVRRFFEIRIQEEIARIKRSDGSMGLLITDIDHFKHFNDTYGHQQGDIVLYELAKLMKDTLRKDIDIPCRYGGEEFAIILLDTDIAGTFEVAERMRKRCEQYDFPGQKKPLRVTFSGGIAHFDRNSFISKDEIIRRADEMLYKAKQSGRNQICVWDE